MTTDTSVTVRDTPPTGTVGETLFTYRDARGATLFHVERPARDGDQARPNLWGPTPDGARWQDNLKEVPRPLPLYRVGTVLQNPALPVVFHRSERDAFRATSAGLVGIHITSVMGTGYVRASDFSVLAGRDVVLCQDNSPDGVAYTEEVATMAYAAGAQAVEVVRLPGLPSGQGVGGWLKRGGDATDWLRIVNQRLGLLSDDEDEDENASGPDAETAADAASTAGDAFMASLADLHEPAEDDGEPTDDEETQADPHTPALRHMVAEVVAASFGEPSPLPLEGTPEVPFDLDMLPTPLRAFATDVAERCGCRPDLPAVALITALGAVVGRRLGIAPKQQDPRRITPNLWAVLTTPRPTAGGAQAVEEALSPLHGLELAAQRDFEAAAHQFEARRTALEAARGLWAEEMRQARQAGQPVEDLLARHPTLPEPPRRRPYRTATGDVRGLAELTGTTPGGLLLMRDDVVAWLTGLAAPGREGERHLYLTLADASAAEAQFDLPSGASAHFANPCLSALGWAPTQALRRYAAGATQRGATDPLLGRFQMVLAVDSASPMREADHPADRAARERAEQVFAHLDRLPAVHAGEAPPTLRFETAAQGVYDRWRGEHAAHAAAENDPLVAAHLAAQDRLMPALALLFHLIEPEGKSAAGDIPGPVTAAPARRAAQWCVWLTAHARSVYGVGEAAELEGARSLLKRLVGTELASPFKVRDIYRRHWSGLASREAAQRAVEILERHAWISSVPVPTTERGGKPTRAYYLNPKAAGLVQSGGMGV
ncbi:MAG: DUF3987 domain-containing protein [Nitrospirota bacterium]|nr:DUF3987 domain-containing protein [Nitrospirota bacterium]